MSRFLIALAATTATVSLFSATAFSAEAPAHHHAHAPRLISQTQDGKPIMLATVTVTATALPN